MVRTDTWHDTLEEWGKGALGWIMGWGRIVHFGALILVLTLSPSSYSRENRTELARHLYLNTAPILLGFTLLVALISMVLTRIVLVTSLSYGLSQYALQLVIRVLVLELIPLTAALFVALRCTIPDGADVARMRRRGELEALRLRGTDPVSREVLPRVVAGVFSSVTLAALSCVVALITAYIAVYGFTITGLAVYTRLFGQVFTPVVTLIFALKTFFFSLAVAIIPMASGVYDIITGATSRTRAEMRGLVRMFAVLLLIEGVSLVGNYY
ncbi:MAG: ABC transporter permease [Comamonadaceae bacterium]|nr:MAG: ABC transporter permease [Comamonadaceae bacterium]